MAAGALALPAVDGAFEAPPAALGAALDGAALVAPAAVAFGRAVAGVLAAAGAGVVTDAAVAAGDAADAVEMRVGDLCSSMVAAPATPATNTAVMTAQMMTIGRPREGRSITLPFLQHATQT